MVLIHEDTQGRRADGYVLGFFHLLRGAREVRGWTEVNKELGEVLVAPLCIVVFKPFGYFSLLYATLFISSCFNEEVGVCR